MVTATPHRAVRRKIGPMIDFFSAAPRRTVPDHATHVVNSDDLWRALATLSARERVVLVLRYYQDLDDQTIADVLGIKPSSVRATASRALASLRKARDSTRDSNRVDERLS